MLTLTEKMHNLRRANSIGHLNRNGSGLVSTAVKYHNRHKFNWWRALDRDILQCRKILSHSVLMHQRHFPHWGILGRVGGANYTQRKLGFSLDVLFICQVTLMGYASFGRMLTLRPGAKPSTRLSFDLKCRSDPFCDNKLRVTTGTKG